MEPKLPTPNFQPERPQVSYEEKTPELVPSTQPEVTIEKRVEKQIEQGNEAVNQMPSAPSLPPPQVGVGPAQPVADDTQSSSMSDVPLVAADEDLIEKEWVDKAKKIVEETKDDPYRREQEVGRLQVDYLRKRYGKELGASQ